MQPIKLLQKFPHMSEGWYAHYGMRNLVESSNSRFKDAAHEALGNPTKGSGRGFAFQYLASALSIVSFNLRAIACFMLKLRNSAVEKPVRTRRRKVLTVGRSLESLHSPLQRKRRSTHN